MPMEIKQILRYIVLVLPVLGQAYLSVRFLLKEDLIGAVIALFALNTMIIFIYRAIEEKRV